MLRPLRAIQRSKGMKAVASSLLNSIPSICTVALLVGFFVVVASLFMVQLYAGALYSCTDTNVAEGSVTVGGYNQPYNSLWRAECVGSFVGEGGAIALPFWVNADRHFDNLPAASLALYEVEKRSIAYNDPLPPRCVRIPGEIPCC